MSSSAITSGSPPFTASAKRWGALWGARADDWTPTEEQQIPGYEEAIRRVGLGAGQRVLDIGCGTGVFLRLVTERGALPFGTDASEALLELARNRVPDAELRLGDMQFLPYGDDSFDLVTGFTSFFFAADLVAAVREAGPGGQPRGAGGGQGVGAPGGGGPQAVE